MLSKRDEIHSDSIGRRLPSAWGIYVQIAVVGLVLAATMAYSLRVGSGMATRYAPQVDACMEMKLNVANAHLWLEEVLTGDTDESISIVREHLNVADWYAQAMLVGGQNDEGTFLAVENTALRHRVLVVQEKLGEFRRLTEDRFAHAQTSGIASEFDRQYDQNYKQLVDYLDTVETSIQTVIAEDLAHFTTLLKILVAVVLALSAVVALLIHRFERQRARAFHDVRVAWEKADLNERWLTCVMASMGDAVIIANPDSKVVYLNPAAVTITGWKSEHAVGKETSKVFNIINEETRETSENPVTRVIRERKVVGLANHTVLISRNGEEYAIADSGAPIYDDSGELNGVVLVFHDVSERRKIEAETQRLKHLLSNIINSMPSVLVGVDAKGKVTQWNQMAADLTGHDEAAAFGRDLPDVFPRLANEMHHIHEAIRSRNPLQETRIVYDDGEVRRFSDMTIFPLIANGVDGAVIRIDDTTERVRMEEMMVQTEKMLSVGGLAAGMAHEINNPLAGILQNTQVIRNRIQGDLPKNREVAAECGTDMETIEAYMERRGILSMMESITESGTRAADIVDNMLSFSHKSESQYLPEDLRELLDKTVDLTSSEYDPNSEYDFQKINIVREYDEGVPSIPCDTGQIQQVFLNILKNGAHAMTTGGGEAGKAHRFILRIRSEAEEAVVEIEDNGPGMDDDTRKRAFEPFFTTKGVGTGTGLGLSVSYFIIGENHGGSLSVEPAPQGGTKFVIRLPLEGRTRCQVIS